MRLKAGTLSFAVLLISLYRPSINLLQSAV
jgi:hypothetical protein